MKFKKMEIFPTSIYSFFLNDKDLLNRIKFKVEHLNFVPNRVNFYTTTVLNDLEDEDFKSLHNWFNSCIENVKLDQKLPLDKIVITQSWANRTNFKEFHQAHKHANSFLSGVFYLSTSETGYTWFSRKNKWYDFFLLKPGYSYPTGNERMYYKERPEIGKLILFPSNITHSVEEHEDPTTPRYSIAFNTFPEGNFEKGGKLRHLNLKVLSKTIHEI